jgi:hypothetical protein
MRDGLTRHANAIEKKMVETMMQEIEKIKAK